MNEKMSATPLASINMPNAFEPIASAVENLLDVIGLRDECSPHADDLRLALVEALNNVVEHCGGAEVSPLVTVRVWREGSEIRVCIEDTGHPPPLDLFENVEQKAMTHTGPISAAPEHDAGGSDFPDLDLLSEGGRGLMLIHACVDRVEARRVGHRNQLILEKSLARPAVLG